MDYEIARKNMVLGQIKTNDVTDPLVMNAMSKVPRERFIAASLQSQAYLDGDVSVGDGRWLIQPMVAARLIQLASVQDTDHALVVPCGSGYLAAVVSYLAGSVVAVEESVDLKESAAQVLSDLGMDTVAVVSGQINEGCPSQAPFDVIIFDGSLSQVPKAIKEQLADGGRLVAVIQDKNIGRATLVQRTGGNFGERISFDANIALLPEFRVAESFVFS